MTEENPRDEGEKDSPPDIRLDGRVWVSTRALVMIGLTMVVVAAIAAALLTWATSM